MHTLLTKCREEREELQDWPIVVVVVLIILGVCFSIVVGVSFVVLTRLSCLF